MPSLAKFCALPNRTVFDFLRYARLHAPGRDVRYAAECEPPYDFCNRSAKPERALCTCHIFTLRFGK